MLVSRIAVAMLGLLVIGLAILFQHENIGSRSCSTSRNAESLESGLRRVGLVDGVSAHDEIEKRCGRVKLGRDPFRGEVGYQLLPMRLLRQGPRGLQPLAEQCCKCLQAIAIKFNVWRRYVEVSKHQQAVCWNDRQMMVDELRDSQFCGPRYDGIAELCKQSRLGCSEA